MRYQQISLVQFKQQFLDRGASESFTQGCVDMYRAKDEGVDNAALRTPENTDKLQDVLRAGPEADLQTLIHVDHRPTQIDAERPRRVSFTLRPFPGWSLRSRAI